jgi:hypothetical protein
MSNKPLKTQGFGQGIYQQSSTQIHDLDTVRYLADGRVFTYAQAGATALAVAKLTCSEAPSANANRETVAANAAIGSTVVSVTFGAEMAADLFKDGWIYDCIAAAGDLYRVKSHAIGTTAVQMYLKEPLRVAWTTSSKATVIRNRQKYVIISPTTLTSPPAGIPPIAVTAYYYFWNQVKGPATCLIAGTAVIGNVVGPLTTAGAVAPLNSADIIGSVGTVLSVDATTEYALINLGIAGY